jgi:anti-sigma B factor antagonist
MSSQSATLSIVSDTQDETFRVTIVDEGWKVAGDIDAATAPQLTAAFAADSGTPRSRIVLDLSEVTFMDSSGLRVLIDLSGREGTDTVVLRNVTRQVARLIEITGLDSVFSVE